MGDNKPKQVNLDDLESEIEPDLRSDDNKSTDGDNKPAKDDDSKDEMISKTEYDEKVKELENLKKRNEASGKEGKRLAEEIKKYEAYVDYIPLFDAIKEDETLQQKIKDHISGNSQPKEEEAFDPDELLADPAKYAQYLKKQAGLDKLDQTVAGVLDKHLKAYDQKKQEQSKQEQIIAARSEFMKKKGFDEDEMQDWEEKVKGLGELNFEKLDWLVNKDEILKNVSSNNSSEILDHFKNMSKKTPSLASLQSAEERQSDDRVVFDSLKKGGNTIDDLLG